MKESLKKKKNITTGGLYRLWTFILTRAGPGSARISMCTRRRRMRVFKGLCFGEAGQQITLL